MLSDTFIRGVQAINKNITIQLRILNGLIAFRGIYK